MFSHSSFQRITQSYMNDYPLTCYVICCRQIIYYIKSCTSYNKKYLVCIQKLSQKFSKYSNNNELRNSSMSISSIYVPQFVSMPIFLYLCFFFCLNALQMFDVDLALSNVISFAHNFCQNVVFEQGQMKQCFILTIFKKISNIENITFVYSKINK